VINSPLLRENQLCSAVYQDQMKRKTIILIVVTICAAGVLFSSMVQSRRASEQVFPNEATSTLGNNSGKWEFKTLMKPVPADPERRVAAVDAQMQKFADGHWLVLSCTGPLLQPDGTLQRRFEVKRAVP